MTDNKTAIAAESLYLLTAFIPVISFLLLGCLYIKNKNSANNLTNNHVKQAFIAGSLITGIFIVCNLLVVLLGGYQSINTLIIFEIYFMFFVPLFVIPGILALVKALSGQTYRFPLIGKLAGIQ